MIPWVNRSLFVNFRLDFQPNLEERRKTVEIGKHWIRFFEKKHLMKDMFINSWDYLSKFWHSAYLRDTYLSSKKVGSCSKYKKLFNTNWNIFLELRDVLLTYDKRQKFVLISQNFDSHHISEKCITQVLKGCHKCYWIFNLCGTEILVFEKHVNDIPGSEIRISELHESEIHVS